MGNTTKVTTMTFAGAVTTIFLGVLGYFAPEFVQAMPSGFEGAMVVLISGIVGYFVPSKAV